MSSAPKREVCAPAPAGGFRLINRETYPEYRGNELARPVHVGNVTFGRGLSVIIAGPCAVESREQTLGIARAVKEAGGHALRGGAFKPRTSPYDFQGLEDEGLEILAEARERTSLPIITEVLDPRDVERVGAVADCLQIGARSMQNFALLREVGRFGKPVLLKRHWAASLTEWLCAAEYVAVEGNLDIILCERGMRTFSQNEYNRNTLDLNVIPAAREKTFLPVIADPSHGTGFAKMVPHAARAAVGAGAHGLIIEIVTENQDVSKTLCDGPQAIRPSTLTELIHEIQGWDRRRNLAEVSE
jgi:3-deoxy-7-phosphoheptulonate synthase